MVAPDAIGAISKLLIAKSGKTPLQFLLDRMRNSKAGMAERIECAKAAAHYVHPKLASIEHSGKDGAPSIKHGHMIEKAHYDKLIGKLPPDHSGGKA